MSPQSVKVEADLQQMLADAYRAGVAHDHVFQEDADLAASLYANEVFVALVGDAKSAAAQSSLLRPTLSGAWCFKCGLGVSEAKAKCSSPPGHVFTLAADPLAPVSTGEGTGE